MAWKHKVKRRGPEFVWYACGLGVSLAYMYPQTLGLEKYKQTIVEKSHGKPVEVDNEVELLAQEIRNHFKWQKAILHYGSDFDFIQTTQPLEFTQKGSVITRYGAVIGIPILFTASSLLAAKENPVAALQKYNISVTEDEGRNLLELYSLSPAAKKFALAKEMYFADTLYFYTGFITINLAFIGTYAIGKTLSNVLTLFFPLPGAALISFLSVVPALGYGCIKFYDWYTRSVLAKSDKMAAGINADVAAGGIEYYSNRIACKQALEHIQENVSSNTVTESVFDMKWRKKELSLEERKTLLEKVFA